MTAYQQPGPATQRIDHLVQFFRERNLSLTLLTRKSSLSQNAADSQTALSWRDFQQIITNARQVLPAHEFDQAAATFWQQPMHRHWVDLARVQRRPFGLLIDLIGEQGFLFEDMPLQIKVKQHDPRRLWIHADSRGESTSNIALSFLIAAEIKSFAALCGLSGLHLDVTLRPQGFDLHCTNAAPAGRSFFRQILRTLKRPPVPRLMVNLDSLRLSAAQLRTRIFQLRAKLDETEQQLERERANTAALLSAFDIPHFFIREDHSMIHPKGQSSLGDLPLKPFSTVAGLLNQLDEASQQDCARLIDEAGQTDFQILKTKLFTKPDTQAPLNAVITLLLYAHDQSNNITAYLLKDNQHAQTHSADPAPRAALLMMEAMTQEAMCITGPNGVIEWFNKKFLSLLERLEPQVVGEPIDHFIPEILSDNRLRSFYQDQSGEAWLTALPARALIGADAQIPISLSARSFLDQGVRKKLYAITDRTFAVELKAKAEAAEARFALQADAIVAGQMTQGAAHDLGNVLTVIQAQTDTLKAEVPNVAQDAFKPLELATFDAANIVKRLLPAKDSELEPAACDLIKLFKDIEPAMALTLGPTIQYQIEIEGQSSELFCALASLPLKNILLNLIANARDAISLAGEVTLRLAPNLTQPQQKTISGDYHLIEIEDNGSGIPTAMRHRIFEPGFTTKTYRGGHGIGLSMIRQLLVDAGADILIEQSRSGGTLVRLFVPKAKKTPSSKPSSRTAYSGHQPYALVVEPTPELQDFIALTLQAQGFRVFRASDGRNAKTIFERRAQELDLIVCELVLPRWGSRDFLRLVLATKSQQRGLIVSASAQSRLHQQLLREIPWENLNKPLSHAALKAAIARATAEKPGWPQADQMLPRPW